TELTVALPFAGCAKNSQTCCTRRLIRAIWTSCSPLEELPVFPVSWISSTEVAPKGARRSRGESIYRQDAPTGLTVRSCSCPTAFFPHSSTPPLLHPSTLLLGVSPG